GLHTDRRALAGDRIRGGGGGRHRRSPPGQHRAAAGRDGGAHALVRPRRPGTRSDMTDDASQLGRLMSAVAHDLRTPLATIYRFPKTIERGGGLDDRQERFLALILAAAADMDRMIENVSTVGHIAEGRLSVEKASVESVAVAAAAVEAVPQRSDGRT